MLSFLVFLEDINVVISDRDFWGVNLGIGVGDFLLFLVVCDGFGFNFVLFFVSGEPTCTIVGSEFNCG